MELVINANRVIAALVKNGVSRKIILSTKFGFFSPEFGLLEVKKYKELIKKKSRLSEQDFNSLMQMLLSKIAVFSEHEISDSSMKKAIKIMKKIDPDDVVFIALCIDLGGKPIWTDDQHFQKQNQIKVLTTAQLAKML